MEVPPANINHAKRFIAHKSFPPYEPDPKKAKALFNAPALAQWCHSMVRYSELCSAVLDGPPKQVKLGPAVEMLLAEHQSGCEESTIQRIAKAT